MMGFKRQMMALACCHMQLGFRTDLGVGQVDANALADAELTEMSAVELEELQERVSQLMEEKRASEKAAIREEIEELLDRHGLKLVDIFEELAPRRRGRRQASAANQPNGHSEL